MCYQEALAQAGYDDTVAVQGRRYQLGQGVVVPAAMRIGMTSWAEEERDLPAAKLVGRWLLSEGMLSPYAMPGTGVAYGTIGLRACYAMSGTDGGARQLCDVWC
eukprot:3118165-Rhodomonas_salina.2